MIFNNDFADKILKRTEKVVFSNRIDSHKSKLSFEYQALAIIKMFFGKKADGFVKSESPDLQNAKTKIGIEVVTSHPDSYHKVKNLENRLLDRLKIGDTKESQKIRRQIEKEGFAISKDNNVFYPANCTIETNTFYRSVFLKSQKIDEYKRHGFGKIGLFVWHLSPVATDFVENLPNEWSQVLRNGASFFKNEFDFIITVVEHFFLFYDKNFDCKKIVEIPSCIFDRLPTLGRMAAEGIINDSDPFWR